MIAPYRFLHRISIRIQIGSKYDGFLGCVKSECLISKGMLIREGVCFVPLAVVRSVRDLIFGQC